MKIGSSLGFDTMPEADLEPILELLQGGDPDVVSQKAGISREKLFRLRDDLFAQVERERGRATGVPSKKIGRNESCPCGSGKKYKHCCLNSHQAAIPDNHAAEAEDLKRREAEQGRLIKNIEETFALIASGRCNAVSPKAVTRPRPAAEGFKWHTGSAEVRRTGSNTVSSSIYRQIFMGRSFCA